MSRARLRTHRALPLLAMALLAAPGARAEEAGAPSVLPACGACGQPLAQQQLPTAMPQSLPAVPGPAAESFRLTALRLNGAAALPAGELDRVTQPYIGRQVTLGDLEELARAITALYQQQGFFLAQAVVPVQKVQGGVVEISVIEGVLGKVDVLVAPEAPISEARVRGFLAALKPGQAVNAKSYERAMLLLSDQPGIRATSALREGAQVGTTDLTVQVARRPRVVLVAEADNHGTKESGRLRAGGTLRWLSPLGIGDNLDLRLLVSNGNALQFGRLAYEAPIGSSGWRAGLGAARVNYELGGQFRALDAQGTADVFDVSLHYPLIRQRTQNLFVRLGADVKNLSDDLNAVAYNSKKRVRGAGLGWAWERRDAWLGGGYSASSGTLYRGDLDLRDAQTAALDRDLGGHRTEGGFTKLTFLLSRLQAVVPRHALYLSLGGQWASKNLDPSEKLALGGARAVRAYPSGERLVDEGVVATAEWRFSFNDEFTPFAFYDAARGRLVRDPTPFDGANGHSLRGLGLGLSWTRPNDFAINATVAWRAGTRPAQTDGGGRNPRLFVQLQKVF